MTDLDQYILLISRDLENQDYLSVAQDIWKNHLAGEMYMGVNNPFIEEFAYIFEDMMSEDYKNFDLYLDNITVLDKHSKEQLKLLFL